MKKLLLMLSLIYFSTVSANAAATDNVLQSIQIDSFKDTYNIVLKSDEKPEAKKNITGENKMTLTLKGIRASEELNTIYNAMNIDSVTVEPVSNDTINVSIQADNVSRSNLVFDTLDTPLGVLRTNETIKKQAKPKKKITLSHPMRDYRPVYQDEEDSENGGFSLEGLASSEYAGTLLSAFKDEGVTNTITIMLIGLIILCTVRLFKKNTKEELQIGLSQSLRDREVGLMQDMMSGQNFAQQSYEQPQQETYLTPASAPLRPETNYGLRSYQSAVRTPYQQHGIKSPYTTSDIQRRPIAPKQPLPQQAPVSVGAATRPSTMTQTQQRPSSSRMTSPQPKVASVDSMKFLDSMAKIYEKNGRADLAQGLKANITKAKSRV